MKRKTIISTLLFLLLSLCFSFSAPSENNLVLTYSQKARSKDLDIRLNSPFVAYRMTIRQNNDGSFELLSPPFLVAQVNGCLRIGELKDARLLSLMLDPMSTDLDNSGFKTNSNFRSIRNPARSPRLSGIALSFQNVDIFSFNPLLNPRSPSGFGFIAGDDEIFVGLLAATQNRILVREAADDLQVNWRQLGIGKNMLFSIIGASAEGTLLGIEIRSEAFMQNAFDALLGGGTTLGWSTEAKTDLFTVSLSHKTGGFGVKLKRLTDDQSPKDSFSATLKADSHSVRNLGMEVEYRSDIYEMPVYGGSSQKRELYYNIGAFWRKNSLKVRNSTSFDLDRGKVQKTEYLVAIEEFGARLEASFTLNRPLGAPSFTSGGKLKLKTDHATLEASAGKVLLEMNWTLKREDYELGVSIDQDRRITASLSFKGL